MDRLPALFALISLGACAARPNAVAGPPSAHGEQANTRAPGHGPASMAPGSALCAAPPLLSPGETQRGSTSGHTDAFHASCAYGAGSPDTVYRIHLTQPSHVTVRVAGSYDTVLYLRSACDDGDTEFACNDDANDARHSAIETNLPAGDYFVFVDGYGVQSAGFFTITESESPIAAAHSPRGRARTAPGEGVTVQRVAGETGVSGTVLFAKRGFTPHGLTRATTEAPAPHFVVEALDTTGHALAAGDTDDDGHFRLDLAPGAVARIRVQTRTRFLGNDIRVVSDPGTEAPYEISTLPFRVEGGERLRMFADVGGVEPAGAFNILAQFVRYLPYVQRGFSRPLPPLFAFWQRGNNRTLPQGSITGFLLEYPRHDGTYALQIQGGEAGAEDHSDSDQFDDPVILHEFTHFVVHTMAGHYSLGGTHPGGELHFPGQALDEGAASAMGCAVTGDAHYWDTAGLEPDGAVLVDEDSETLSVPLRGIGSQDTAQTLLWDMMDGAEGITDRDDDGVAIGLTGVMRIYASFRDDPRAFPAIHTMLERAVALDLMTAAQATRLVHSPAQQGFDFPVPARDEWPTDLTMPAEAHGLVDGQTQPAPSGGRNVPTTGLDATKTYRFTVARRGLVSIDLAINGPGTQESGTDLDLMLFTRTLRPVAQSLGTGPREAIHRFLDPGTYILLVRDGDVTANTQRTGPRGNRANFTLQVRQSADFH